MRPWRKRWRRDDAEIYITCVCISLVVNPYACGTMKLDGDKISAEVICNRASMALRHVKDCGDSMACAVYTEQMTLAALSDNRLVSQFEQALKKDELQNTDR